MYCSRSRFASQLVNERERIILAPYKTSAVPLRNESSSSCHIILNAVFTNT